MRPRERETFPRRWDVELMKNFGWRAGVIYFTVLIRVCFLAVVGHLSS